MKKMLLMAAVAVMLMACNGNGASLPSKDKKAVEKVALEALAQIGQPAATVDKALTDAGFVKAEAPAAAPKKMKAAIQNKFKAPADESVEVYYVYNIDAADMELEGDAAAAKFNSILKKGKAIIVAYVVYYNDKVVMIGSETMVAAKSGQYKLYTDVSDAWYAKIPADAMYKQWEGGTTKKDYTDHAEFVADIAAATEGIEADEVGYAITKMDMTTGAMEGFVYDGMWVDPDEEVKKQEAQNGFDPYCMMVTVVADASAVM